MIQSSFYRSSSRLSTCLRSCLAVAVLTLPLSCRSSRDKAPASTSSVGTPATTTSSVASTRSLAQAPQATVPRNTMPQEVAKPSVPTSPGALGATSATGAESPAETATSESTEGLDPALLTAGIVEVKREGPVQRQVGIRTGRHQGYERVVFEFETGVPGYHLEYIDKPVRACGSGDVVELPGDGWLQVRLYPAQAHTDEGAATIAERELSPKYDVMLELERTCDFEGVVTWVVGTASPNRYRVFELTDPPRLVLDIAAR